MKTVQATDFIPSPKTVTEMLTRPADQLKPVFEILTERNTYQANTLDGVMRMWRDSGDKSPVKKINRIG